MTGEELRNRYFDWMYGLVCNDEYSRNNTYKKLFSYLYDVEFTYQHPMDGNRYEDGIDFRYHFGREHGIPDYLISSYLDNCPCSVLEMMLALSVRIEENIMDNPDYGNRVGQWFWEMIVSLGLGHMTDSNFDLDYVDEVLYIFLNRKYNPDGKGSLFTMSNPNQDMRNVEIWYQMSAHLNELMGSEI